MSHEIEQVQHFMSTFGQATRLVPQRTITAKELSLRLRLIQEELQELFEACSPHEDGTLVTVDPVAALDALTDLRYVVYGAFHTFGLAHVADAAFNEVHRSNMSKGTTCPECKGRGGFPTKAADGIEDCVMCNKHGVIATFSESGKILKPATYSKPNLEQFINE